MHEARGLKYYGGRGGGRGALRRAEADRWMPRRYLLSACTTGCGLEKKNGEKARSCLIRGDAATKDLEGILPVQCT